MDYNAEMVGAGRERGSEPEIVWSVGDAQRLALPDACADAYVISFGIRNVTDILAALKEARRVLKPGGRFLCLEFSHPVTEALRKAYEDPAYRKRLSELSAVVAAGQEFDPPYVEALVPREVEKYRKLLSD
jgi:demethylmenaquinone methyltransferase/2-methoxy-6-polyprenyl-1,4-benzoquinol methylase